MDPAPPDRSRPSTARRTGVTLATLAVGTALLAATLRVGQGSVAFVAVGLATAACWLGGAALSGPVPIRPIGTGVVRTVGLAVAVAVGAFAAFAGAAIVARHLPLLSGALERILGKADAAPRAVVLLVTLPNGLAEEVFFRGALRAAVGHHRQADALTLAAYVAVTVAAGNAALVVAALVMGAVFGWQRRVTHGVLAPAVTHVVWSTLMLLALPR